MGEEEGEEEEEEGEEEEEEGEEEEEKSTFERRIGRGGEGALGNRTHILSAACNSYHYVVVSCTH